MRRAVDGHHPLRPYEKRPFRRDAPLLAEPDEGDGVTRFAIIDGQQRTSTLTLLIAAFARRLRETGTTVGYVDADFVEQNFLRVESDHKLVLSRTDRDTLFSLIDGTPRPERVSERIVENYEHFYEKMLNDDYDPALLWEGMQHLLLISANLVGEDRPQLIFEALNSRGTPLTTGTWCAITCSSPKTAPSRSVCTTSIGGPSS